MREIQGLLVRTLSGVHLQALLGTHFGHENVDIGQRVNQEKTSNLFAGQRAYCYYSSELSRVCPLYMINKGVRIVISQLVV
jgi:hypothetical protein